MKALDYLRDVKGETRHVSWPTQTQTVIFTILIVILSVFTAVFIGAFDYIFAAIVQWLLN